MKRLFTAVMVIGAVLSASADLLMKVDFSGTGGAALANPYSIPVSDTQVTLNSSVTAYAPGALIVRGTSSYSAGGTAVVHSDWANSLTQTSGTRFDINLEEAAAGKSYTITNLEFNVTASDVTDTGYTVFWYEGGAWKNSGLSSVVPADTTGLVSIDLTSFSLDADETGADWMTAGTPYLRLVLSDSDATPDTLAIDYIQLNGTVIPEPVSLGLFSVAGLMVLCLRRLIA
jgi:hypothetical protein